MLQVSLLKPEYFIIQSNPSTVGLKVVSKIQHQHDQLIMTCSPGSSLPSKKSSASLRVTWFVTSSDVIASMIARAAIEKNPGRLALPNMGSGNEDFHKLKGALFLRRRLAKSNHFPIQSFIVSPNVMDAQ